MDAGGVSRLRYLAGGLAVFVAAVHLFHPSQGGVALLVYAQAGYLGDPRPLLFTLGAVALLAGVILGYQGFAGRRLYLGGLIVVAVFPVGFILWHTVFDHGAFWPYLEPNVHGHGNPLVVAAQHLVGDGYVFVSKVAELSLLVVLLVLLRVDTPSDVT